MLLRTFAGSCNLKHLYPPLQQQISRQPNLVAVGSSYQLRRYRTSQRNGQAEVVQRQQPVGDKGYSSQRNSQVDYLDPDIKYIPLTKRNSVHPLPFSENPHSPRRPLRRNGNALEIWNPRKEYFIPISERWLRDNCSCSQCRNQDTAQRQLSVLKGRTNCKITEVQESSDGEGFEIVFGDGHKTTMARSLITNHRSRIVTSQRRGETSITPWDAQIAGQPPSVDYGSLDYGNLGTLLHKIREYGFCFVNDTPPTPEATENLLQAIGPIRNTHYGGFYDFTADLSSKDTAYTSESLEPHTDNTYFTEPAGLQALHLLSHTDGSGGESSLVDGFSAAIKLFEQDKKAYRMLSLIPVWAHASGNEGISIQPSEPLPVLSHSSEHPSHLTQVRWNNADRAGVACSHQAMDAWYDAAAKFDAILSDPQNQYWFQLTPGKLLIFDNWRVLHGRAAFSGKRRMCGGYIPRDDFISKFRMTNMSEEDIRASTVTG